MLSDLFASLFGNLPPQFGGGGGMGQGGQQPFDPAALLGLYQPQAPPSLPQPPGQVGFGGLPPELQQEAKRQEMLTLATLLGSVSSGQIGTAIAQASAARDPIRRGYTEQFNQQQGQQYEMERRRALEENALATQQQQYQQQSEVAQGAIGLAGELARTHPDRAQEIQSLMLQNAGNPAGLMESLAEWKSQRDQKAFQEEAMARQQEALQGMGVDPGMYQMFPDVAEEQMMSREGLGRYQPEPPDAGSWTSAGNGYLFNTRQGPGSARQIYQPTASTGTPSYSVDWHTGQVFDRRTGQIDTTPPEGFTPRPRGSATDELIQRILQPEAEGPSSTQERPAAAAPPLGPAGLPRQGGQPAGSGKPSPILSPGRAKPPEQYVREGISYLRGIDPQRADAIESALQGMSPAQAAAEMEELLEAL